MDRREKEWSWLFAVDGMREPLKMARNCVTISKNLINRLRSKGGKREMI